MRKPHNLRPPHHAYSLLTTTAPALAADPARVLRLAYEASGGAAWSKIATLHTHSTLKAGSRQGGYDRWEDIRHGRFVRRASLPPRELADGFDGVATWNQPRTGFAYMLGDEDARLSAVNDSFGVERGWWFPERRAATVSDAGSRAESGRSFDVVRITPEGGRPFDLWVDRTTHLVDRTVEQRAEELNVVQYADYRAVAGVMLPFTIRSGDGVTSFSDVETVENVEVNPAIPDEAYALPAAPSGQAELAGGTTTVPFRFEGNRIIAPVMVNAKGPFEAEFDSGGGLIVPPAVVADLALSAQGRLKETGGGEGFVTASAGLLASASIGDARLLQPAFKSFAWDQDHPRRILVGLEFLQNFVVRFDFDKCVMTLTRPDRFNYQGAGAIVPFHFQDNQPEVTGTVDGVAGSFTVDTGDAGSLLLIAPFARRYGFAERYHATIPYGGQAIAATHGVYARGGEVTLNGLDGRKAIQVSRPITRISQQQGGFDANRYVSANIGIGILRQFNVTFDYPRQRIIFEQNGLYGSSDIFDRSGMSLKDDGTGWIVTAAYAGGPAEQAGIKQGDTITSINGQARPDLDRAALRKVMTQAIGTAVVVKLKAGVGERVAVVKLHDVL